MTYHRLFYLCFLSLAACARAPSPELKGATRRSGADERLGSALIPSHAQEKLMREQSLADALRRTIERLDGVQEARVHLNLADRSPLSADPESITSCAIVIRPASDDAVVEATIRELVTAAVPGLEPSELKLFSTGNVDPPQTPKTQFIGPIEVTESSASMARLCIGALLLTCLGLALGLIYFGLKTRNLRRSGSDRRRA